MIELRERLAALEHEQWAHWTTWMLDNISEENVERWKKQVATPYEDLSEKEKTSDREWADKVLAIVEQRSAAERPVDEYPAVNAEYYFMDSREHDVDDEDEEGAYQIYIVHKRFWHLHHHLDDSEYYPGVELPSKFDNVSESTWEFPGPFEEARRQLLAAGLVELKDGYWGGSLATELKGKFYVGIQCDTPAIFAHIESVLPSLEAQADNVDILAALLEAQGDYTVVQDRWASGNGAEISILDKSVYTHLPAEPPDEDEE
jgi:hypothetical protein